MNVEDERSEREFGGQSEEEREWGERKEKESKAHGLNLCTRFWINKKTLSIEAVSYTHLDVYKRQTHNNIKDQVCRQYTFCYAREKYNRFSVIAFCFSVLQAPGLPVQRY